MTLIAPHFQKAKKRSVFGFLKKDRFFVHTPGWLKRLYPHCLWDMPDKDKVLYLTFDDGPHPTITPFVLELLKKYDAKATFFCIGNNVVKYPETYQQLLAEGHAAGNHTQHHINGWKTGDTAYLEDIGEASAHIRSHLFRPPYGRISRSQIRKLKEKQPVNDLPYSIVMWNILAGDWIEDMQPEKCYERISQKISSGDILVFHDSDKAWDRMSYCLPLILEKYTKQGYRFSKIS